MNRSFFIVTVNGWVHDQTVILEAHEGNYRILGGDRPSFALLDDEDIGSRISNDIFGRQPVEHVQELDIEPGSYWPRIARPLQEREKGALGHYPGLYDHPFTIRRSANEVVALMSDLDRLFLTLDSNRKNFVVFGNRIRNLLILSSTECETQWRAVLAANGYKAAERLTTRDYVRLLRPMRLDEYEVSLTKYPWLGSFKPFQGWTSDRPTQTLGWYDSYNAVKHDREAALERGNLEACLMAVCAAYITLIAQFGQAVPDRALAEHFGVVQLPGWQPRDVYCYSSLVRAADSYNAVPCPEIAVG